MPANTPRELPPEVTTAVDTARETFELQEPPIGDGAPSGEGAVDALTALRQRYDQVRLDLVNAEQALREQKTLHRRDITAWMRERDHLTDVVIPELERRLRIANAVTASARQRTVSVARRSRQIRRTR